MTPPVPHVEKYIEGNICWIYLAAAGTLVSAPVYVSVVLETAGVFEQFAALVAAVASHSSVGVKSLAHTVCENRNRLEKYSQTEK